MFRFFCLTVTFFVTIHLGNLLATPPSWIDLPADDYAAIAKFEDERFSVLNLMVNTYQALPKSSAAHLNARIQSLGQIADFLSDWMGGETIRYRQSFLSNMRTIALNKQWYLAELEKRAALGQFEMDYLRDYHTDVSSLRYDYRPVCLANDRHYDSVWGAYWGECWYKTIDPCHRALIPYYDLWMKQKGEKDSLFSFFLWLEDQNLSKDVPYVVYLDSEDLRRCTVMIENGLLYLPTDEGKALVDYCRESQEYIFNIDLDKKLFLLPSTKTVRHVSISHGKPILGAGNVTVSQGVITSIELDSGHYLPSIEIGFQILEIFKDWGIELDPDIPFSYYDEHEKYYSVLKDFQCLRLIKNASISY